MLSLTAAQIAALGQPHIVRSVFVWCDVLALNGTTSDPMGFWDGAGNVTLSSRLYYGSGNIAQVGSLRAVGDMTIPGFTLTLSPLETEAEAFVRGRVIAQRPIDVDIGIFNVETRELIDSTFTFFRGIIDRAEILTNPGGESSISISCESISRALTVRRHETRSHASEVQRDEDDEFYSYTAVQRKPLPFGKTK